MGDSDEDDELFGSDESASVKSSEESNDDASGGDASDGDMSDGATSAASQMKMRREKAACIAAKQRAAAKLSLKRIEKIAAAARKITENSKRAEIAARAQRPVFLRTPPGTPPRTPPHTPVRSNGTTTTTVAPGAVVPGAVAPDPVKRAAPRREHVVCTAMAEAVGFDDGDPFAARILKSNAREFNVNRIVHTLKTRFSPFSCGKDGKASLFYTDTALFYSRPTDLCCLWCTEPINGVPLPLPVRHWSNRLNRDDWIFHVCGQYCTFSCVLAAARARPGNRSDQLTRMMMQKVYNVPFITDVQPAPNPACLVKFGGLYTTEQYRSTGMTGIRTSTAMLPFLPFSAGITEIESIDITITEVGGAELACRRVRGGITAAGLANPILHVRRNVQRGKFATAPSIREQLDASDRRMRLQMESIPLQPKKKTLLDFMTKRV